MNPKEDLYYAHYVVTDGKLKFSKKTKDKSEAVRENQRLLDLGHEVVVVSEGGPEDQGWNDGTTAPRPVTRE